MGQDFGSGRDWVGSEAEEMVRVEQVVLNITGNWGRSGKQTNNNNRNESVLRNPLFVRNPRNPVVELRLG